jgi:hypothetical protein
MGRGEQWGGGSKAPNSITFSPSLINIISETVSAMTAWHWIE